MFDIKITIFLVILVVSGLNEVIKKAIGGDKIKDYIPAIAVATGVTTAFGLQYAENIFQTAIIGAVIGLASSGLFDNFEKIKKLKDLLKETEN